MIYILLAFFLATIINMKVAKTNTSFSTFFLGCLLV